MDTGLLKTNVVLAINAVGMHVNISEMCKKKIVNNKRNKVVREISGG